MTKLLSRRRSLARGQMIILSLTAVLVSIAASDVSAYPRRGLTSLAAWRSNSPSISASARHLAFRNAGGVIYVRDLVSDAEPELVSATRATPAEPVQGNDPIISADGRFVAFDSDSNALVKSDRNGSRDVFVYDQDQKIMERASLTSSEVEGSLGSTSPTISANGRYVAFHSASSNFTSAGQTCSNRGCSDVFVRDRELGTLERVSVGMNGASGLPPEDNLWSSGSASISADGRYVAFYSRPWIPNTSAIAPVGVPFPPGLIFVRDRVNNRTELVSETWRKGVPNATSSDPVISGDGRFVAFVSAASDLVPSDRSGLADIFVKDLVTDATERVSLTSAGSELGSPSSEPAISADGRFVAFTSVGAFVPGTGDNRKVFLRDRTTGTTELISSPRGWGLGTFSSQTPTISGDGSAVAFVSDADNLAPVPPDTTNDVFLRRRGREIDVIHLGIGKTVSKIEAAGWVTVDPIVMSSADDDADAAGLIRERSADLLGAQLIYRPEAEDLRFRASLGHIEGDDAAAAIRYAVSLRVGGVRYEIRVAPVWMDGGVRRSHATLYECDDDCSLAQVLPAEFGREGVGFSVHVPVGWLDLEAGQSVNDVRITTSHAVDGAAPLDEVKLPSAELPQLRGTITVSRVSDSMTVKVRKTSLLEGEFRTYFDKALLPSDDYRFVARLCLESRCDEQVREVAL